MDQITGLLHNDLAVLLLPLLLGIRGLRKKFATSSSLPTISEVIITVAMFGFGIAIAYANLGLHPAAAQSVVDIAWVQGILYGVALMLMDLGVDATSTRTADAQRAIAATARLVLAGALSLALLGASRPATAETRPILDASRLSAGPRVVAQIYDFDDGRPRELGFVAGGAASYSLTGRWSADGSLERKFNVGDTVPVHWRESAGLDVLLPPSDDKKQWFLAFERAWYHYAGDASAHAAWAVRLQWSFGAQDAKGHDAGFAIVRGRYDVEDGRRDIGAGLQPQLIGGR